VWWLTFSQWILQNCLVFLGFWSSQPVDYVLHVQNMHFVACRIRTLFHLSQPEKDLFRNEKCCWKSLALQEVGLWRGMISTQAMAHGVQYTPLPALKLQSGNQSRNQPLIMLFAVVTCWRRKASAASFSTLVYEASLLAKNISEGLLVSRLWEKTGLRHISKVCARCGILLEMGWGNMAP